MAQPVLTWEGRRLLDAKADYLSTVALPSLQVTTKTPSCQSQLDAIYAVTLQDLRRVTEVLREAAPIPTRKHTAGVVELGDLVTLKFLDIEPGSMGSGEDSVDRFLLVHPAEGGLDEQRITAASPLGLSVLGCTMGDIAKVEAPGGEYLMCILAAGKPRGRTANRGPCTPRPDHPRHPMPPDTASRALVNTTKREVKTDDQLPSAQQRFTGRATATSSQASRAVRAIARRSNLVTKGDQVTTTVLPAQRQDLHNSSVDYTAATADRCGFTRLASGHVCQLPHRHPGSCDLSTQVRSDAPTGSAGHGGENS
ncbi:MAG: GreA/GreB family elongation factor [Geodermatophilaceae bacterium]